MSSEQQSHAGHVLRNKTGESDTTLMRPVSLPLGRRRRHRVTEEAANFGTFAILETK